MDKVITALDEIQQINESYEISSTDIEQIRKEIQSAKVCIPVIGKFSAGKSALINTLLGYNKKILKENITPETAVPAEILYSDSEDSVTVFYRNGSVKEFSVEDYRHYEVDANVVKNVRIRLQNRVGFLKEIPDVMLVDMPGFESGFEIHNRAIDEYLPQSLAYIIAVPADDMILRTDIGNILKELCLYDMPLCVAITKYDKRNEEDFELMINKLKQNLRRYIGDREITFCNTSSFTGDAEELENFLKEVQEQAQEILENKYKKQVLPILENTENYLITTKNSSSLSESELEEQEEKFHKQLDSLTSNLSREKEAFREEITDCIREIKDDVQMALENNESEFIVRIMNKEDIKNSINTLIRRTVTSSLQKRFIPKVEKYLKRIDKNISGESIGDVAISMHFDVEAVKKNMTSTVVMVVAGIIMGMPLFGVIMGLVMKLRGDKKREEIKEGIRRRLEGEVFPEVLDKVGTNIEKTIKEQVEKVDTAIEEELSKQQGTLEKAMKEAREKRNQEKAQEEKLMSEITNDLIRIGEIKDGLR